MNLIFNINRDVYVTKQTKALIKSYLKNLNIDRSS